MQTTNDRDKGSAASPNATEPAPERAPGSRPGGQAVPRPSWRVITASTAIPRRRPPARPAGRRRHRRRRRPARRRSGATETARDMANRAAEQAGSAMAQGRRDRPGSGEPRPRAGRPGGAGGYDQGARAGEYVTRNVHQYPATALLIAAAVGYGVAYLIHGGGSPGARTANRYDRERN